MPVKKSKKRKVMVAMSGGVDSSVAAYLLKKEGNDVVGVTMCFGLEPDEKTIEAYEKDFIVQDSKSLPSCCGREAINDAKRVCEGIGIAHYVFDFSDAIKKYVIDKFIDSYLKGKTPNPCIDCNSSLKFGILLNKAINLGCDYLATGHYARITPLNGSYQLCKPADLLKDQTYFLYAINKNYLSKILFPLGSYKKSQVRDIALKASLPVADKKESQEICFIADDNYKGFLKKYASQATIGEGNIKDIDGKIIGRHKGFAFYTIGQRKGMGLSAKTPLYVIKINPADNEIIAGERKYLKSRRLDADNVNILVEKLPETAEAKIRYNHEAAKCKIKKLNDRMEVTFEEAQEAVTPGQAIVFYREGIVLGGGRIKTNLELE